MVVSRVAAYRMEPRLLVPLGSCGLALALGDLLFAAIFGASAVSDYRDESPGFFRELAPGPSWRKGPGATRAMPTTIALPPSPQGHEQRRVSSPPQATFGRGPSSPHERC